MREGETDRQTRETEKQSDLHKETHRETDRNRETWMGGGWGWRMG